MTKKLTKAIGLNGFFVANAFAVDNSPKTPVITGNVVPAKADTKPESETGSKAGYAAAVVADGNGNQAIVSKQNQSEQDQLEQDRIANDPVNAQKLRAQKNYKPTFVAGTPSEKDLTEKQAVELAKKSVDSEYALTDDTWSKFSIHAILNVVDPEAPIWGVTFYPTNPDDFSEIGNYYVTIDSHSGDIIKIMSAADGVG